MRLRLCFILALVAPALLAQVVPARSLAPIKDAVSAGTVGRPVTDVTMTGTSTFTGGNHPGTGKVTLIALATGKCEAIYAMPDGTLTEIWSGPDGGAKVSGRMGGKLSTTAAGGSVTMPGYAWFAPALLLARASAGGWGARDHGAQSHDGSRTDHVAVWPQPKPGTSGGMPWMMLRREQRVDLYLDPATDLPSAAVFLLRPTLKPGAHPPAHVQLATEEVRYSGYENVGGAVLPTRLEIRLGTTPIIAITVTRAEVNTGATIAPLR